MPRGGAVCAGGNEVATEWGRGKDGKVSAMWSDDQPVWQGGGMKRHPESFINRRNWKHTREYLDYCAVVRQCKSNTCELYRCALDCLFEWATSTAFGKAVYLRPTFPAYLDSLGFSLNYTHKTLAVARAFFSWATGCYEKDYAEIRPDFIASLVLRRRQTEVQDRALFTVQEVIALVKAPAMTLIEQRDRAAAAFLFLSGMRDAAFCSLPICAVDFSVSPPRVRQWPSLGGRTKFGKAANTMLLLEPAMLLDVAREWDSYIRELLPECAPWFPLIELDGLTFAEDQTPGEHRSFARRLQDLCARARVEPKSPHKLRNGHIVHALKLCRDMADLKAVSQNVMHESVKTTEVIYGRLGEDDIAHRLSQLGTQPLVDALFQQQTAPFRS